VSERKIRRFAARRKTALVLTAGAVLATAAPAAAADLVVTTTADSSIGSLRDAINASNGAPGVVDRITFAPGVTGTITLSSSLPAISGSLQIVGPGAGTLAIDGAGTYGALAATGSSADRATISGLTTTNTSGVAIAGGAGHLTVSDVVVRDGEGSGLGVSSGGSIRVERTTITEIDGADNAGAPVLVVSSDATIVDSTITGNQGGFAGGVANLLGGTKVENTTISGNSGTTGGVSTYFGQRTEVESSTITGNTAQIGGGVTSAFSGAPLVLHNTIVAGNAATSAAPDVFSVGSPVQASFSVIGTDPGAALETTVAGSNKIGVDPGLAPLAANGGTTETHAIGVASPAFDGADPGGFPATDQRGVSRPQDRAPDIGAFELADQLAPTVTLAKPKSKFKVKKKAKISLAFTADERATFECSLRGGKPSQADFRPCTSPTVLKLKGKPGKGKKYTFSVRARDSVGKVSKPASANFKVIKKAAKGKR
jgi:hypothetical protein